MINTSWGGHDDEQAVVPALRTGHLRGAAVDRSAVGIVSVGELYPPAKRTADSLPNGSNTILCPRGDVHNSIALTSATPRPG